MKCGIEFFKFVCCLVFLHRLNNSHIKITYFHGISHRYQTARNELLFVGLVYNHMASKHSVKSGASRKSYAGLIRGN